MSGRRDNINKAIWNKLERQKAAQLIVMQNDKEMANSSYLSLIFNFNLINNFLPSIFRLFLGGTKIVRI